MSELRKRPVKETEENEKSAGASSSDRGGDTADSEDDRIPDETKLDELTKVLPQASDRTTDSLDEALSSLPTKWRNWIVRGIFSILMISGFGLLIWMGPLALMFITLLVQVMCFQEIISIGYAVYRIHGLPWFRSLSWYFLITSNYFFYGESMVEYLGLLLGRTETFRPLVTYHRFFSFCLYIIGFVLFVLSLVKKYYMRQFSLFAWTHVTLLLVVTQSYLIVQNLFEGLIWFIVPVSMIICNDVMAYIFGFFFGKTPLIKLSPKKTWEGFVGGGFATVVFGMLMSHILCQFQYFVCPIEYSETTQRVTLECVPSHLFQLTQFQLPGFLQVILKAVRLPGSVMLYPFILHSLALSLFSSIIGPFGGFFASGFKRAFKVKDFGALIPGHGGIVDRFDCQYLMATFVNVYIDSFIRAPNPQRLLQQVFLLKADQQMQVFLSLNESLSARGLLP